HDTFHLPLENSAMMGMVVTLVIRLAAIRWHLKLPTFAFNRYQACRYGLDGTLTDVRSGEQRSIREWLAKWHRRRHRLYPAAHRRCRCVAETHP
ncbi:hypothetical protein FK513_31565, partial [Klebsiella pneumoniae]|nr:hypothetical protein [Klebsiella pneumoniae]